MEEKINKLKYRAQNLKEYGLNKISQYINGIITEEELQNELNWIDKENEDILAEFAVLELLENINYN